MVPPVPSPNVRLIGVPPLKDVKVKVVPLMPPGAAARDAAKVGELPVLPLSPSAASALPEPEIVRSEVVPVLICSAPLDAIDELTVPEAVLNVAAPDEMAAVCTPVARSMALSTSAVVPRSEERRVGEGGSARVWA